jgi:hypothetical protein
MAGLLAGLGTATRRVAADTAPVTVALDESAPVDRRRLAALLEDHHEVVPLTCALAGVVTPDVVVTWPAGTLPTDQLTTIWPTATPIALTALPNHTNPAGRGGRGGSTDRVGERVVAGDPGWRPDLRGLADRIVRLPAPAVPDGHRTGWWADGGVVRARLATHRVWPAGTVLDDADLVVWGGPHPDAVGCTLSATGYGHHGEPVRLRLIASAGRLSGGRVSLHGWITTGDDRVHLLLEGRLRLNPPSPTGSAGARRSVEVALTGRTPDAQPDRRFTLHLRSRQVTRGPVPAALVAAAS